MDKQEILPSPGTYSVIAFTFSAARVLLVAPAYPNYNKNSGGVAGKSYNRRGQPGFVGNLRTSLIFPFPFASRIF